MVVMKKTRKSGQQERALFRAARQGEVAILEELLRTGADVNCRVQDGPTRDVTPLMVASNDGTPAAVQLLLERGADPLLHTASESVGAGGRTALHYAITLTDDYPRRLEVVRMLLAAGADPNAVTNGGATPLGMAAGYNNRPLVELLLAAGAATVPPPGATPILNLVAGKGHVELLALLLERGADPDQRDENGRTALMYAVTSGATEAVTFLLEHGADPAAVQTSTGRTVLMNAALYARDAWSDREHANALRIIQELVARKIDLSARDPAGQTALDLVWPARQPPAGSRQLPSPVPDFLLERGACRAPQRPGA